TNAWAGVHHAGWGCDGMAAYRARAPHGVALSTAWPSLATSKAKTSLRVCAGVDHRRIRTRIPLRRVGVLWDPTNPPNQRQLEEADVAGPQARYAACAGTGTGPERLGLSIQDRARRRWRPRAGKFLLHYTSPSNRNVGEHKPASCHLLYQGVR